MRTTNNMLISNMMYYMNHNLDRMNNFQTQMATGKQINVPSDDPVRAARALKFRTDVSEISQFQSNSNDAYSWMELTESTLSNLGEILQNAYERSVQAANGTMNPSDREKVRQELSQLKTQAAHLANTSYAGRYIFSGYATDTKLMNEDGTYACTVGSTETAAIKSGLVDLKPAAPVTVSAGQNQFNISLDGLVYAQVTVPAGKTYDGQTFTLEDMAKDIQASLASAQPVAPAAAADLPQELKELRVTAENGRLVFSLNDTTDTKGNRMRIYLREESGQSFLNSINIKTQGVPGMIVSRSEDINYQVGIGDLLNVNVPGTTIFGSQTKDNAGDFMLKFNMLLDSLYIEDSRSYISGQTISIDADTELDLLSEGPFEFEISIGGGSSTTVVLPAKSYGASTTNSLDDLAADIQGAIQSAAGNSVVKVENRDGRITFITDAENKIVLKNGAAGKDLLRSINVYTGGDGTAGSFTAEEGLNQSISNMQSLLDTVLGVQSDLGARMNRAELTLNRLGSDELNFTKLMSENEDVDMAEVIMNLQNEENVYRSSLSVGARVIMPTLMDFLR